MERGVKSPLGNSSRPGEWPSVGAGLVRKQASSSPHTAKSRSGPAAGAQGSHQDCPATPQGVSGVGCRTEDRVLQTAPGTNLSVPEQPDRKGRSSQCSELRTGHTGRSGLCPQGHRKVGRGEQNHQEMVNWKQFLGGKRRWPEWIKQTENVSSSLFQIPFWVVISGS